MAKNKGVLRNPGPNSIKRPPPKPLPLRPKRNLVKVNPNEVPPNLFNFYNAMNNRITGGPLPQLAPVPPRNDAEHVINEVAGESMRLHGLNNNFLPDDLNIGPNRDNYFDASVQPNGNIRYEMSLRTNQGKPDNSRASHELQHLNSTEYAYEPQLWNNLNTFSGNYPGGANFTRDINQVKDKIDPAGVFKRQATYRISQNDINNAQAANNFYTVNNNRRATDHGKADEFPAFIIQNLHRHWDAGRNLHNNVPNPNPLNQNQRQLLSDILGTMRGVHTVARTPNINRLIGEREASLNRRSGGYVKKFAGGGYVNRNYDPVATGLGSFYDYINHRYARGGGGGLGSMGRFFGLYPMRG